MFLIEWFQQTVKYFTNQREAKLHENEKLHLRNESAGKRLHNSTDTIVGIYTAMICPNNLTQELNIQMHLLQMNPLQIINCFPAI